MLVKAEYIYPMEQHSNRITRLKIQAINLIFSFIPKASKVHGYSINTQAKKQAGNRQMKFQFRFNVEKG